MKKKWIGVTHPSLDGWLPEWFYRLWKRFCCPRDWHLFDETMSWVGGGVIEHYLICDACDLEVNIDENPVHVEPVPFKGLPK